MKVALIPPKGLYRTALQTDTQMILALPELLDDPTYCLVVDAANDAGNFIIMDNGSPEGTPARASAIRSYLRLFQISELVLPDVLTDPVKTRSISDNFMRIRHAGNPSLMYVVHGNNVDELRREIDTLPNYVNTIGLPRYLVNTTSRAVRIELSNWIRDTYKDKYAIHLLGLSTTWTKEVAAAARYASHIRSVDTSAPYNYAIAGYDLNSDSTMPVVRSPEYFQRDWSTYVDKRLLQHNIDTMIRWAR